MNASLSCKARSVWASATSSTPLPVKNWAQDRMRQCQRVSDITRGLSGKPSFRFPRLVHSRSTTLTLLTIHEKQNHNRPLTSVLRSFSPSGHPGEIEQARVGFPHSHQHHSPSTSIGENMKSLLAVMALCLLSTSVLAQAKQTKFDVLIKGGTIYDGTGGS